MDKFEFTKIQEMLICEQIKRNEMYSSLKDPIDKAIYLIKDINVYKQELRNSNKHRFITSFIDEIPELSYYEAKQLHKKLGSIYVEWNDD
uniref:Uncharacterized protein n=1 Tax=viral metagenome TaxID=1070528 RepID=A0A6C0DMY0_9ZZZZ